MRTLVLGHGTSVVGCDTTRKYPIIMLNNLKEKVEVGTDLNSVACEEVDEKDRVLIIVENTEGLDSLQSVIDSARVKLNGRYTIEKDDLTTNVLKDGEELFYIGGLDYDTEAGKVVKELNCLSIHIAELEEELQSERKIVDYYADDENWCLSEIKSLDYCYKDTIVRGGKRARERQKAREK